ncbi:MAG: alpha/beta hydrolase [Chryseolinea sp.]
MKEIYLLSGLGADKRVFDFIDFTGFSVNHISWIEPLGGESIESYAKRLLQQIPTSTPIIIGISFGGMISIEIAKLVRTEKVVLISSAETKTDIPLAYKIVGSLHVYKIIPVSILKSANIFSFWLFGTRTKKEKDLLRVIMRDTDTRFLKWSVDAIAHWRNEQRLDNVTRIHGTADRILPLRRADYVIKGGGHLMIVNKAQEVTKVLRKVLS